MQESIDHRVDASHSDMKSTITFLGLRLSALESRSAQIKAWHLVLLAFLVRMAFYAYTAFHPEMRWFADSQQYYLLGFNLIEHGQFTVFLEEGFPESQRLPLYPLFLVGLGEWLSYEAVVILQCLLSAAKLFFLFQIARILKINALWTVVAALLIALNPTDVFLSVVFLSETLFTFILFWAIALVLKMRDAYGLALAGMVLGLAALTRGQGLWIFLVFLPILIRWFRTRAAFAVLGFSLVIAPWILRNHQTFDRWFYTDSATVVTLFFTLPQLQETAGVARADEAFRQYTQWSYDYNWSDPQQVNAYMHRARNEIVHTFAAHKMATVQVLGTRLFKNAISPGRGMMSRFLGNSAGYYIAFLFSGMMAVLALSTIVFCWMPLGDERRMLRVMLLLVVMVMLGSSAFTAVDARFRNPADMAWVLIVMLGLQQWFNRKNADPFFNAVIQKIKSLRWP